MARGLSLVKIIGILLLAAGVVALAIGVYQFVEFYQSVGGKLAGEANRLARAFGGSAKIAGGYQQPLILMISGAVAALAGLFIYRRA
ncbi:MAG: hypothetical protein LBK27_07185 [Treponema sp.]|jgi:hypothetical protein|nr:hypothetical protein [Treponema sp.]